MVKFNMDPDGWCLPQPWPRLATEVVDVWRVDLTAASAVAQRLRACLAEDERARADRFLYDRHRTPFIVARAALRVLLSRYLAAHPGSLGFDYGAHGKPCLAASWAASGLTFNLSHSGDVALVAVGKNRALGVDVEQVRADRATVRLAERFFAPEEVAVFSALPPAQWTEAFFNAWTRKEAYIKAHGKGLALPLDQFVVSLAPGAPAQLRATPWQPADVHRWQMQALHPGEGYAGALLVEGTGWRARCWQAPSAADLASLLGGPA